MPTPTLCLAPTNSATWWCSVGLLEQLSFKSFVFFSLQPNHAYTLTVSCSNAVHNVGVRRRNDGRLALGYARRGERSFSSVPSLLRHHKKRRLLLVTAGGVIGATTLDEAPQYYQTPKNVPVSWWQPKNDSNLWPGDNWQTWKYIHN